MLQAVWFALANLQELDDSERALGLDRAAVLIEKHTNALETVWHGSEMPEALRDVMREAREELSKAAG